MAVNVLGEEIEDTEKEPSSTKSEPSYSPYDDLAFVMYVDTEIADLVRSLDEKKKTAVAGKTTDNLKCSLAKDKPRVS
jgi:hypothetical protein